MHAIERAVALCQTTLSYGRAQEAPPDRKTVPVESLIEDVRESLGLSIEVPIRWIVSVERGLSMEADPDQMFRVIVNLGRNAIQALETHGSRDPARDQIRITGRREGDVVAIEVSDTGPGLSDRARSHLYQAFQGSTRPGGSGLGLAIAAELVRAHGGEINLVPGTMGATFRITIPDGVVDLVARSTARARA
jgi:signal transduction histidine kinase